MSSTEMFSTDRTMEHHGNAQPDKRFRRLSWWQAITTGAVAAAVVNLVIFFIGGAAGASFAFLDRGTLHEIGAWGVVTATVAPLVVGTGLATLLAHWWSWVIRWAQVIGGGLALLTVAGPLMTDADGATRVALSLMHVMVAVAVVVTLEAIRRRTRTTSRQV
jgi:Flp pilus assembly pilin Flp